MAHGIPVAEELTAYYNLVTDITPKIGYLKDYDYAYTAPGTGMFILEHDGHNFLITAELLSRSTDASLSDALHSNRFRFEARQRELEQMKKDEEKREGEILELCGLKG